MSPAARQLLELLAMEISEELLYAVRNADESGQEQRRRIESEHGDDTPISRSKAT
jgi:hypothetical protein